VALQCENGNVRRNNDEHREKRGPPDLCRRVQNSVAENLAVGRMTTLGKFAEDIFDDNHRAIHDDSKVHRSQ